MTEQQLLQILISKKFAPKALDVFLTQHSDKRQFFEKQYEKYRDRFTFYIFVKYYYLDLLEERCLQCGKYLKQKQIKDGYKYCSYKCCNNNELKKQKSKQTTLQKYGVQVSTKCPQVLQRVKKTNMQKYGCQFPMQSKKVVEKSKKTCLQKYGAQIATRSQVVKDKIYKTNLQRHGYKMPLCNKDIRNKRTINQKKQFITNFLNDVKKFVVPLFDVDKYNGCSHGQVFKWKCVKCGNQFESKIQTTNHLKENRYVPRCLVCYPYVENCFKSNLENEVIDYINNIYGAEIKENNRIVIQPYQLDVYVESKQIAIEFDGVATVD